MIVIIGASGGLGGYLLDHFAPQHTVVATYNNKPLIQVPEGVETAKVDVRDPAQLKALAERAATFDEEVTLLYFSGVSRNGIAHRLSHRDWEDTLDVNLSGAFYAAKAFLPLMRQREWGRIIFAGSVVGQMGVPGTVAYAASKAGLGGITRALAAENAVKNITINTIALGYFSVGIIDDVPSELQEQIRSGIPARRFGNPKEAALTVEFLMSNAYLTGATINVNGGLV